jgi:hypothetical protein
VMANRHLAITVRIEHSDAGDDIDRQPVARGGHADRFWIRDGVDAIGGRLVLADVGMEPGHIKIGIGRCRLQF